jgi:Spy/CpxP family protein refolding chaperone
MKKWMGVGLMVALMLCLSCAWVYAAERIPKDIFKGLNLTADQQKQMQSLFERQRTEEKKDFEKIKELQGKLDEEFLKDRPDESKIRATANDIKKIQIKLLDKHFDRLFDLRKILTPEQFKKFIEKGVKNRKKFSGKHKGFWPPHPPTGEGFMPPPDKTK